MTIGVVGLGLLGGSVALDLVAAGERVLGLDPDPATRDRAAAQGIVAADGLDQVATADLVIVASPTAHVAGLVADLADRGVPAITDVASVRTLGSLGWPDRPLPPAWVGGHPMAGTERRGFAAAHRGLVVGAPWLLTPHDAVDPTALAATIRLALRLGARPVVLTPDRHDTVVATTSHLPHLLAWALHARTRRLGAGVVDHLAGPSFRDATRVAASSPEFWADLLDRNGDAVRAALADVQSWLDETAAASRDELVDRLADARRVPGPPPTGASATTVWLADGVSALDHLRAAGADGRAVVDVVEGSRGLGLRLAG